MLKPDKYDVGKVFKVLPDELLWIIFGFCSSSEIIQLSKTNKTFYYCIIVKNRVFKQLFRNIFPFNYEIIRKSDSYIDYLEEYKKSASFQTHYYQNTTKLEIKFSKDAIFYFKEKVSKKWDKSSSPKILIENLSKIGTCEILGNDEYNFKKDFDFLHFNSNKKVYEFVVTTKHQPPFYGPQKKKNFFMPFFDLVKSCFNGDFTFFDLENPDCKKRLKEEDGYVFYGEAAFKAFFVPKSKKINLFNFEDFVFVCLILNCRGHFNNRFFLKTFSDFTDDYYKIKDKNVTLNTILSNFGERIDPRKMYPFYSEDLKILNELFLARNGNFVSLCLESEIGFYFFRFDTS